MVYEDLVQAQVKCAEKEQETAVKGKKGRKRKQSVLETVVVEE